VTAGRSLDILRDVTGEIEPTEALVRLMSEPAQVDELAERLVADPPAASTGMDQFELWPVLNARMSTFATGGGSSWFTATGGPAGINLMAAIDPRDSGSGRFPNAVLRALLYCHGLVLEDPLALAADLASGTAGETRQVARRVVLAAAASLVEIAPLIDSGVVQTFFFPAAARTPIVDATDLRADRVSASPDEIWEAFEAAFVEGLAPELQELWQLVRAGDRSPPLQLVEEAARNGDPEVVEVFIKVLSELRPSAVIDNALGIIAESLSDLSRVGGACDLLCPTPLFARLALSGNPLDDMRLHELAHTNVPGLDQLLAEDVVAMRAQSEAFDLWRTRLSLGLERARSLRAEFGTEVDVVAVVAEVLADARAAIFNEVERSRTLSSAAKASLGFVAGAIGGAVSNSTGGLPSIATGATGGVLALLLQSLLAAGDPVPGFISRHYIVFDRPTG
jgi:hypothetical protein